MQRPLWARLLPAAGCAAIALALPGAAHAATQATIDSAVTKGANYLDSRQNAVDGTFPIGFGFDIVPTAMAAAGRNAADVANGAGPTSQSAVAAALVGLPDPDTNTIGDVEQGILTGYAAGIDPARVAAGTNVVAQLATQYNDGSYGDAGNFSNAYYGALALNRVPAPQFLIDRSVSVIRANQHNDGGWGFSQALTETDKAAESASDPTGPAIAALCESGVPASDHAVARGVDFLESQLNKTTGGFDPNDGFGTPPNADTNGVAVSGLNACGIDPQAARFTGAKTPIDFLIGLQNAQTGAFPGFSPVYATQDAVRGLAGAAFSADPPARATPTAPRTRAVPTVADGTSVPLSLAVDDGAGGVTFCRVTASSGTSLAGFLATAGSASTPAGCATGAAFTGGQLSNLNGKSGTWAISTDRGGEQVASDQQVRFGDFVALRRTSSAVPATAAASTTATPVPAAVQARSTPSATTAKSLRFSAKKRTVTVPVSCALDNRSCQGTVYIVDGKTTLGRRPFTIGGGKTTKLGVKLYAKPLKRLGKRKSKKVRVNVFSRDGNGVASTSSRIVTFTRGS